MRISCHAVVATATAVTTLSAARAFISLDTPDNNLQRRTGSNFQSSRRRLNSDQQWHKHKLPRLQQKSINRVYGELHSSEYDDAEFQDEYEMEEDEDTERQFLERELSHIESLEELLKKLESDTDFDDSELFEYNDVDDLLELLKDAQLGPKGGGSDGSDDDIEDEDDDGEDALKDLLAMLPKNYYGAGESSRSDSELEEIRASLLEQRPIMNSVLPVESLEDALLQGVVPAGAGVGSECLPGDYGFDPLNLATKDYIQQIQTYLLGLLSGGDRESRSDGASPSQQQRPTALILRDYREAEIRHGRLAMLAAVIWPFQEMLDRLLLDEDQFGPIIYGPVTLPYFPLLMTLIMMLLGYLDIYAKAIKDRDEIGDAFLPGDCFWDPLRILEGAPARMKRNMQERELFNGRVAMLAIAAYLFEEATTHLPLIAIEGNDLLLEPAYQVPFIQEWLDAQFSDMMYR